MKKFFSSPAGKLLAALGLLAHIGLIVSYFRFSSYTPLRHATQAYFLTILIFILLWFGINWAVKAWRRRKQEAFDATMAAKEGIDDRRREWESWTKELKKQGIDRYSLPFYLLVGEPQSGKSILLQNSDLRFPFGQNRLSGIGGTRGCDWWFTDQAVILDLAGRLFTHEGGASDEAEWAAFLELLATYRPLCPANGVLLVIPCDRLLEEGVEHARDKANKMQAALLTLTGKIQAQLPVYVVLTKADKVFGFAECVHRLDAEKRHEMFGWSRDAELAERPLELAEVEEGFAGMVDRARTLRAEMMSTVKVPEAIGEVDRMYAFPDELAALYPNLEVYLKTVFSDSDLIDRLFFRGVYLTSGLQSGAPIAKVCGDLLPQAREADRRNLEALFAKQRAYFIKDVVRERVFVERGLVRPTHNRVRAVRQRAVIGYGVAAAIAAVTVLACGIYVYRYIGQGRANSYSTAIESAVALAQAEAPTIEGALATLATVRQAVELTNENAAKLVPGGSVKPEFERLYASVFDRRLLPLLRDELDQRVQPYVTEAEPTSFAQFNEREELVSSLLSGFDLRDEDALGRLSAAMDTLGIEEEQKTGIRSALELRTGLDGAFGIDSGQRPASSPLHDAAKRIDDQWEKVLADVSEWKCGGELDYVIACMDVDGFWEDYASQPAAALLEVVDGKCMDFNERLERLRETDGALPAGDGGKRISMEAVRAQLADLAADRVAFARLCSEPASDPDTPATGDPVEAPDGAVPASNPAVADWGRAQEIEAFLTRLSPPEDGTLAIPFECVVDELKLAEVCSSELDAVTNWSADNLRGLETNLAEWREKFLPEESVEDDLQSKIFKARCAGIGAGYESDLSSLREQLGAEGDAAVLEHLCTVHEKLREIEPQPDLFRGWLQGLERLLERCIDDLDTQDAAQRDALELALDCPGSIDGLTVKVEGVRARMGVDELKQNNRRWANLDLAQGGANTLQIIDELDAYRQKTPNPNQADLEESEDILSKRLRMHTDRLREYWSDWTWKKSGPVRPPLSTPAADIVARVKRENLEDKLRGVDRLEAPNLFQEDVQRRLQRSNYEKMPLVLNALDDFEAHSLRVSSLRVIEGGSYLAFRNRLRDYAQPFVSGTPDGPTMVESYLFYASGFPPLEGVIGLYLNGLRDDFHELMLEEIRDKFWEDLGGLKELAKGSVVLERLYSSALREADPAGFLEGFNRLLLPNGPYLALLRSYKDTRVTAVEGEPGTSAVSISEGDGTEVDFERFLFALWDEFFKLRDGGAVVGSSIRFKLTPNLQAPRRNSIWYESDGFSWFYVRSPNQNWQQVNTSKLPMSFELDWPVQSEDQALRLNWSDAAQADAGGASVDLMGSIAPLLLAWSGRESGGSWLVSIPVSVDKGNGEVVERDAPFYLDFQDRVLPDRPIIQ